jgi:hypothetical protein
MALLVESIDINPHEDYPVFIDFAYQTLDKLNSGEDLKTIFESIPDGFEEWLINNAKKAGYGITFT